MSFEPPGASGTTRVIGRLGKSDACADASAAHAPTMASRQPEYASARIGVSSLPGGVRIRALLGLTGRRFLDADTNRFPGTGQWGAVERRTGSNPAFAGSAFCLSSRA